MQSERVANGNDGPAGRLIGVDGCCQTSERRSGCLGGARFGRHAATSDRECGTGDEQQSETKKFHNSRHSVGIKNWISDSSGRRRWPRQIGQLGMFLVLLTVAWSSAGESLISTNAASWKISATATLKETFDSNVYLQDEANLARRESLVTSLRSQFVMRWMESPVGNATISYQPEAHWFHSESSENFVLQRAVMDLSGRATDTGYEFITSAVLIDGDSSGLIWSGPGGAPATGAATVRDRRDAAVYRSSLRITQNFGAWFARPVATFYLHDFQTDHRATPDYQSFVDRGEVTAGLDLGYRGESVVLWIGYRYGAQEQARLLQFPEEYDSRFHRVLFGIEGRFTSWLKGSVNLGPEFRRYGNKVHANFGDRDELNFYVEANLTLTPTDADEITLLAKRFEQPGSSGRAAYEDSTYEIAWRHKFCDTWTVGLSGRAYGTAFLKPAQRDDWIFSESVFVNYRLRKSLDMELSYTHESGETTTPAASGREYRRHLVAIGVRYQFDLRQSLASSK